jgi:hypothetical protein
MDRLDGSLLYRTPGGSTVRSPGAYPDCSRTPTIGGRRSPGRGPRAAAGGAGVRTAIDCGGLPRTRAGRGRGGTVAGEERNGFLRGARRARGGHACDPLPRLAITPSGSEARRCGFVRATVEQEAGHPALRGVRVLTLAVNLPGPAAASRLRDMGAHVVKVEPPGGDPLARMCPAYYEELRSGQKVVRLDLKDGRDRASLDDLLEDTDLLLTASRPAALGRLGSPGPNFTLVSRACARSPSSGISLRTRTRRATTSPTRLATGRSRRRTCRPC